MHHLKWLFRFVNRNFSDPSAHRGRGYFIIACLLLAILYYAYYYNVLEYISTTPFAYFRYPLDVDMAAVVKKVLNNQNSGVDPLNDRYTYPYVLNCDKKCKDEEGSQDSVFLMILIKSRIENFEQRHQIRRTWGREDGVASVTVRRAFLLGVNPMDKTTQHRVGMEHQDYNDIVQQYFLDTYFNNTLKMMMGFQWATQYCESARFIAFFDDDYFVNINSVIQLLQAVKPTEMDNLIIGYIWKNAMPLRIRDNKWYVSLEEYPFRFWPPYPTAGSFFVPMMTAEKLYVAMQYTKVIRFDDVFLGIVAWKLKTKLRHNSNLYFYDYPYDKYRYRRVIAAHGFSDPELLFKAWKEQTDMDKNALKLANVN